MQNTTQRAKKKKKRQRIRLQLYKRYWTNASFVVGEDDAGTYLHYILPAHPDHNCEMDALVRRQKGPEGSYPSLSGRWGDQVDWTQILPANYLVYFPRLTEVYIYTHLLGLNYSVRYRFSVRLCDLSVSILVFFPLLKSSQPGLVEFYEMCFAT